MSKILIVEDDILISAYLEKRLNGLGHDVCGKADSGEMAVELAGLRQPDLVLMDIVLRGEMDGIQAAEVIREQLSVPVVFLTSYADTDRLERAKLTYPFGYLLKPFQDRDLKITIEMALYAAKVEAERGLAEEKVKTILHDLQVHKVQLELQNDELRRTQNDLQIANSNYKNLYNNAPVGYTAVDKNGFIIQSNNTLADMIKFDGSSIIGSSIFDLILHEDRAEFISRFRAFFKNPENKHIEIRMERGEYEHIFVDIKGRIEVFHQTINGKLVKKDCLFLAIFDISSRKKAEKARLESEAKFSNLFNTMISGFGLFKMIYDDDGKPIDYYFVEVNPAHERLTGLKASEIIGRRVRECLPNIEDFWIRKYGQVDITGEPLEIENWVEDLQNWYRVFAYRPQKGYVAVTFDNITESKKAEIQLKNSEEKLKATNDRFQLAVDSAGIGVWDLDLLNDKLEWDKRMYKLYGLTPEQFSGAYEAWRQGVHPDDFERAAEEVEKAISGLKKFDTEFRIVLPNKEIRHIRAFAKVIGDEDGQPVRMIGINYDITEKRIADANLRRAKELAEAANRAKSEFLANMSHEIRTPLNSVIGFLQVLQSTDLTEEQKEYVQFAVDSGNNLLLLLSDILDLSKIEARKMVLFEEEFNVHESVGFIIKTFESQAFQKGLELDYHIDDSVPSNIVGDSRRLRQILLNLVGNAVKFTPEGVVRLEVKLLKETDISTELMIKISDTGIGIPTDRLNIIFDAFIQADGSSTRTYGGAGLGLSIVKRLVDLMRGSITVECQESQKTVFTLILPFKKTDYTVSIIKVERQ